MNARARSLAPFSLPLCVQYARSLTREQASERASQGPWTRASLLFFVRALFFFPGALTRSLRALYTPRGVPSSFCQGGSTQSSSTSLSLSLLSSWSDTSDYRRRRTRATTTMRVVAGRLTPVVASPAIFPRASHAYLLGDLSGREVYLCYLRRDPLAVIKRTPYFVTLLSDDKGGVLYTYRSYRGLFLQDPPRECKYKCIFSAFYYFQLIAEDSTFSAAGGVGSIRKIL